MGTRKRSPAKPAKPRRQSCAAAIIPPHGTEIGCTPLAPSSSSPLPKIPKPTPKIESRRAATRRRVWRTGRSRGCRYCCRVVALAVAVACMRQGRPNGGVDGERGGADAAAGPVGAVRRQRPVQSHPSSSASSSSRGGEAAEGGGRKQGRRKSKRREEVLRAIRDRLPPPPACWGNVSVVQERRGRRERPGDAVGGEEEGRSGAGTAALPAWCCLCPEGDCSLEPNPSANGKEDPGLRSIIERNDFYSDDCNPHAAAAAADDDDAASHAADFD